MGTSVCFPSCLWCDVWNDVTYVRQSMDGSVIPCCQLWWVEAERLMKTSSISPSVCVKTTRLQSDWQAQPNCFTAFSCPADTTHIRSNYVLFYPHNCFPSPLWELCERTRWRGKMRFEPSPLSLSIRLQALAVRGSTLEFSSQAQFTASHSEGWLMWGGVHTISSCSADLPKLFN